VQNLQLWAQPWWVNLLILVPLVSFFAWRKQGLQLSRRQLILLAVFSLAFGFLEAAVVVYLGAAGGLLPGSRATLADLRQSVPTLYAPAELLRQFPPGLLKIESFREAATMVMLITVAALTAPKRRERWAAFLWAFALWDVAYYAGLWAIVRWPASLKDPDVLFLIPVPWIAQVWFPVLVSGLTLVAVARATGRSSG
jgi:hypothetical protein